MRFAAASVDTFVRKSKPEAPVVCVDSERHAEAARRIVGAFPGDVLYAVKCNDHPMTVEALAHGGIRHFDVASLAEVKLIRRLVPHAQCHYMHPVKSAEAIREAHHRWAVNAFTLDHEDELDKILANADSGERLTLVVRLEVEAGQAVLDLSGKFGATIADAAALMRRIVDAGHRVGATFHVGSHCLDPQAFGRAIDLCGRAAAMAGVELDVLDAGGGFPASYTGSEPLFEAYVEAIVSAVDRLPQVLRSPARRPHLQCEPGRALCAEGQSVLVRVELRRGSKLFLNDGVFGTLSELRYLGPVFPMRVLDEDGEVGGEMADFQLYGPTCDSIDAMPGPFSLPADVQSGDWIEIGMMGAYSNAYRTRFNGFHTDTFIEVGPWGEQRSVEAA